MFKPAQQKPTQEGTDVGGPVISAPLRMRATVQASQSFLDAMQQTGVTPEQVASNITNFYSGLVQRFVDTTRQYRDVSGLAQHRRTFEVPGMRVDYRSNYGAETLEYTVYPQDQFERAGGQRKTDFLLDGYVELTNDAVKRVPVPKETYWIEIGGVKHQVDRVAVGPPAHDAGVGWTPFNPDVGSFDPDAWVVGVTDPQRVELISPAVTDVTHFTPLIWQDPFFNQYPGGWEIPAVPIPDHTATASIFNNGKLIATVPVPITDTTTFTTVILAFGNDALNYQGPDDALQPDPSKVLRKILPQPSLLFGYPYLHFDPFHPVKNTVIVHVADALWDKAKSNTFTITGSETFINDWTFQGQFYDRRKIDKVVQSPHFGPQADGAMITCNDKIVTWTDMHFFPGKSILINFADPTAILGDEVST